MDGETHEGMPQDPMMPKPEGDMPMTEPTEAMPDKPMDPTMPETMPAEPKPSVETGDNEVA